MNLKTYIDQNNLKTADYKRAFGVSPTTIWRILNKKFVPRPETAKTIEEKTKGKVSRLELLYP